MIWKPDDSKHEEGQYLGYIILRMKRKIGSTEIPTKRLTYKDVLTVGSFTPWWVRCAKCRHLAYMTPKEALKCECKCLSCGALYQRTLSSNYEKRYAELPLWLRANFRGHVFWALNEEHLCLLERVIGATLRERPKFERKRLAFTTRMPFNLPSWLLSAKNRPDLLGLIQRLKKSIPRSKSEEESLSNSHALLN